MRSKPSAYGYQQKQQWLKDRFMEGLKLKIIQEDHRPKGFIEYTPSEYSWRAVEADNYIMIHCLWIVGKDKG